VYICVELIFSESMLFPSLLLGKIPLRQLVYRVHDLPPSMRPLVYDFGQIPIQKEMDYTHRIVQNYVRILQIYKVN